MKLSVKNDKLVSDLNALKSIPSATIPYGDKKMVGKDVYAYYPLSKGNGVKPQDITDNEKGRWIIKKEHKSIIDVVPDNYDFVSNNATELTDIVIVHSIGESLIDVYTPGWTDKKCVRDRLKTLVYTKMQVSVPSDAELQSKWDLLTAEEKSIAVHWFLVGKQEFQEEIVNDDRYWIIQAENYRKWTERVKEQRLHIMEAIVFRRVVDVSHAKQILADLSQIYKDTVIDIDDVTNRVNNKVRIRRMADMYIEGFTSLADDGEAALRDFINSETGTPFEGNGFRNYTYTFRTGHTANSVADELLTVIDSTW